MAVCEVCGNDYDKTFCSAHCAAQQRVTGLRDRV